jgi:hypothetical protein
MFARQLDKNTRHDRGSTARTPDLPGLTQRKKILSQQGIKSMQLHYAKDCLSNDRVELLAQQQRNATLKQRYRRNAVG